jgi:hypothetical protein
MKGVRISLQKIIKIIAAENSAPDASSAGIAKIALNFVSPIAVITLPDLKGISMNAKLIKAALLLVAIAELAGCAPPLQKGQSELNPVERRPAKSGETVWLMQVLADNPAETLELKPAMYPNGVFVCALENLSRPCLPKLSEVVAEVLAQKGIVIATDQSQADVTLYFETWFESYSSLTDMKRWAAGNPTLTGKDFAPKIERSLETGNLPEVHKRFRPAPDPFSAATINANDEQKFIYVSLTAIEMDDTSDFPGDPAQRLAPSKNPWLKQNVKKKYWIQPVKRIPATRTLIGNYNGEVPTEVAASLMLKDATKLLVERTVQQQAPMQRKKSSSIFGP